MRRKKGQLIPIEITILEAAAASLRSGDGWLHGYALAKLMADTSQSGKLTAHGTLYKALGRLAESGLLDNVWEDPEVALAEGRPRRRLYRVTGLGQKALIEAHEAVAAATNPGIAPA